MIIVFLLLIVYDYHHVIFICHISSTLCAFERVSEIFSRFPTATALGIFPGHFFHQKVVFDGLRLKTVKEYSANLPTLRGSHARRHHRSPQVVEGCLPPRTRHECVSSPRPSFPPPFRCRGYDEEIRMDRRHRWFPRLLRCVRYR